MKNDIYDRLKLAENALLACANEENMYLPSPGYEIAHNVGRWWEAALLSERSVGTVIPERQEKALSLIIRALMGNGYALLLNDVEVTPGECVLNLHNLREGLLALTEIINSRSGEWARRRGHILANTIDRLFCEKSITEQEICDDIGTVTGISTDPLLTRPDSDPFRDEDFTPTSGRAIEGLILFYKATGDEYVLSVAKKLAEFHYVHSLRADGSAPGFLRCSDHVGHNHSYLGTVRGLLLYGIEFDEPKYVEAVYNTYAKSFYGTNVSYAGYTPHDLAKLRVADRFGDPYGDHASCMDVAYIAYLLALRGGHPELFDDAERLMRRMFFVQTTEGEGIEKGAWGTFDGWFAKGSVIDVYACIIATFCRVLETMKEHDERGIFVNLLFSVQGTDADVTATRDDFQHLRIVPHRETKLFVRIPSLCERDTVRFTDESGKSVPFTFEGIYAVAQCNENEVLDVSFALTKRTTIEKTWISNIEYSIEWLGDDIVSATKL